MTRAIPQTTARADHYLPVNTETEPGHLDPGPLAQLAQRDEQEQGSCVREEG